MKYLILFTVLFTFSFLACETPVEVPKDTEPPEVTVLIPNGGETITCGAAYPFKWVATDDEMLLSAKLFYSIDDGANWDSIKTVFVDTTIVDSLRNDTVQTSYSNTHYKVSTNCLVKVVVTDAAGNTAEDQSDDVYETKMP